MTEAHRIATAPVDCHGVFTSYLVPIEFYLLAWLFAYASCHEGFTFESDCFRVTDVKSGKKALD